MKALINKLSLLLIALTLTSCGGGGGGTGGAFQPPPGSAQVASLTASSATGTISTNNFVDITITARNSDNSLAKDGTSINALLTPTAIGVITNGSATVGSSTASGVTTGGVAAFRFSSGVNTGGAHLVFSTVNTAQSTISTAVDITVSGSTTDQRLTLSPSTITLPLNPNAGDFPFIGSPYMGEVTITRRHQSGQLITGTEKDNTSIAPLQIAAFSILDDPATPWVGATKIPPTAEGNEFLTELGSGPVNVTGGQGTVFIHAQGTPGVATLIVTAVDPDSGQTISASVTVNIVSTVPPLPATVSLSTQTNAVYTSTSGGTSSSTITAVVQTGASVPVPDPGSGNNAYDNIQFDIIGDNPGHASLSAVNAAGVSSPQGATSVRTHTSGGIANVVFIAGTQTGPIQIKATADRSDNNVDTGIQDPVSATITMIVSDGKLFSIAISSPVVNGLTVNSISGQVSSSSTTPGDPNATYSIVQSATATDRAGNPVLPGTVINFGLVDAPASNSINFGSGNFLITGASGDPKENGTIFTDLASGHFKTAGGGAGPGDTLLVFGHSTTFDGYAAPIGNRDLESSRKIQSVETDTQLTVASPFNPNDDTGVSVNNFGVIPYVIGHATAGNITAAVTTNSVGVASASMTYAASHLGQYAYVWAQGTATTASGTKTIGDVAASGYPGVAPAVLSVPSSIVGNTTTTILVCVTDALIQPMAQQVIGFAFENTGSGFATIDPPAPPAVGQSSGFFMSPTDASGCATGIVVTSGLTNTGTTAPDVVISADGQQKTVKIAVGGAPVLQASPSALTDGGSVLLSLTDDHGNAIQNVAISVVCTQGAAASAVLPTGTAGTSHVDISATGLDAAKTPKTATCTFTAADGATAIVNVTGRDICLTDKTATGCDAIPQTQVTVNLQNAGDPGHIVKGSVTVSGTELTLPSSGGCSIAGTATSASCGYSFDKGTQVSLKAVPSGATQFFGWTGGCGTTSGLNANFTAGADATCTANFICTAASCP
ncbi:hypothetical protein ELE36_17380 [Pseudolysobacter antarcticus]|uniref:Bacterial repeat domain-containing protein n=1 Tax=Pseudolysobacter antarcticus TaxID=2511995 RepID=A0A411HND0_9GAMM|nr:hypothetical protein [Pseudolysobacter antarcticus]QBB71993.1 hypothetical protein ELE36_17380 [Pseudolysobacter antarcticus]